VKPSALSTAIGNQWRGLLSFFSSSVLFKSSRRFCPMLQGVCNRAYRSKSLKFLAPRCREFRILFHCFIIGYCARLPRYQLRGPGAHPVRVRNHVKFIPGREAPRSGIRLQCACNRFQSMLPGKSSATELTAADRHVPLSAFIVKLQKHQGAHCPESPAGGA
jgi:hypothetical protein